MIFGLRDRRLTTWPPRLRYNGGSASLYSGATPVRSPHGHERGPQRTRPAPPLRSGRRGGAQAYARRPLDTDSGKQNGQGGPSAPACPRGAGDLVSGVPRVPTGSAGGTRLELGSAQDTRRHFRAWGSNPSSTRETPRLWTTGLGASVSPLG